MLQQSFLIFKGISARRERELWSTRIWDWAELEVLELPQKTLFDDPTGSSPTVFEKARRALKSSDIGYFATRLDRSEHYRIALAFPDDCLFLDIETTGLSRYYNHITVIGWSRGSNYGFFVKGQTDDLLRETIASAKCLVTFNGTLFDIPFIRQEFPEISFPAVHIDLRFLSKRVALTGGQKEIEKQIKFDRRKEAKDVTGEIAPVLWHKYVQGDLDSLRSLLNYNAADLRGMRAIFDAVVPRLLKKMQFPKNAWNHFHFLSYETADAIASVQRSIEQLLVPFPAGEAPPLRIEDIVFVDNPPRLKVVGIDLTGSEARPSGWCLLDGREATTDRLGSDDEIVARTMKENPHVVSIDSPLSLPDGRITVEDSDPGRNEFGIMRYSERVLKRRGVNVYPALLPSMQRLTARGILLAQRFRALGMPVIESYPGAAQDIMRIPRKREGLEFLEQGLASFGVSGPYIRGEVSHDELDAITSAVVGVFFWAGMFESLGRDPLGEEALVIPDLRADHIDKRNRLVIALSGPLGAGKTTAARHFEGHGYSYCRYSEVIASRVAARKSTFSREDLQDEGQFVHEKFGQRWLGRELLRPIQNNRFIVIDGLRFPDDHAYLTEVFGAQLLHLHIVAPRSVRKKRFLKREGQKSEFDLQDLHAVEQQTSRLAELARDVVDNQGSLRGFLEKLDRIVHRDWKG
jgi:uncharacterized protein YprB with RNaseH-like and TPR domain/predicted nuclease with RNAse H fold/dephospho-CoA kinase